MSSGSPPPSVTPLVPAGAPAWITPELITVTLDTWQPYYPECLTVTDAVEILHTVGRLLDCLGDSRNG